MSDPGELLLDSLVADSARKNHQTGWALALCVDAREAGGSFRYSQSRRRPSPRIAGQPAADPVRAAEEAERRARSKTRRYCAANGLNRLGTLTYRGDGCHDLKRLRGDVAAFFRALRSSLGGKAFPYLWTAEWHKTDHGLHVHFAVGRFVPRSLIAHSWPHGFVHIKLLGNLPVGSGVIDESRVSARYLSKYVGKDFDAERFPKGWHRYEVAQRFQPEIFVLWGRTWEEVVDVACEAMREDPEIIWFSDEAINWQGRPPALWMQWRG